MAADADVQIDYEGELGHWTTYDEISLRVAQPRARLREVQKTQVQKCKGAKCMRGLYISN
jgi:hypothetical protein